MLAGWRKAGGRVYNEDLNLMLINVVSLGANCHIICNLFVNSFGFPPTSPASQPVAACGRKARTMEQAYQLLVFRLDGRRFSLRLSVVERVERAVEITPLPQMPENVLGIVNLRGQVVPVFNLRRRFHLRERELDPRDRLIFARTARRPVALVVDAVSEVLPTRGREVVASGEILPGLDCVEGVAKLADGLVLIHDLDRFLSVQEETALDEAMQQHE